MAAVKSKYCFMAPHFMAPAMITVTTAASATAAFVVMINRDASL